MEFLFPVLLSIHILVGLGVIGLVLLQHGKGADMGAAFGSGASGSLFGASGSANFLSRTTGILAAVFFFTSLGLSYVSGSKPKAPDSVMEAPLGVPPSDGTVPVPLPSGQSGESPAKGDKPAEPSSEQKPAAEAGAKDAAVGHQAAAPTETKGSGAGSAKEAPLSVESKAAGEADLKDGKQSADKAGEKAVAKTPMKADTDTAGKKPAAATGSDSKAKDIPK